MVPRGGEEAGAEVPDGGVSLLKTTEAQSRRLEEQSRKAARPTPKPDVLPSPAPARDLLEARKHQQVSLNHCTDFPFCLCCQDSGTQTGNNVTFALSPGVWETA